MDDRLQSYKIRTEIQRSDTLPTGSDGGANLEIYGDLSAKRVIINQDTGESQAIETRPLWHKLSGDAVNISENSTFSIGTSGSLQIRPGEWLWIGGHLAEQDDFPNNNDNLGFIDKKIRHDVIGNEPNPSVEYTDNDQHVVAQFTVIVENEF